MCNDNIKIDTEGNTIKLSSGKEIKYLDSDIAAFQIDRIGTLLSVLTNKDSISWVHGSSNITYLDKKDLIELRYALNKIRQDMLTNKKSTTEVLNLIYTILMEECAEVNEAALGMLFHITNVLGVDTTTASKSSPRVISVAPPVGSHSTASLKKLNKEIADLIGILMLLSAADNVHYPKTVSLISEVLEVDSPRWDGDAEDSAVPMSMYMDIMFGISSLSTAQQYLSKSIRFGGNDCKPDTNTTNMEVVMAAISKAISTYMKIYRYYRRVHGCNFDITINDLKDKINRVVSYKGDILKDVASKISFNYYTIGINNTFLKNTY